MANPAYDVSSLIENIKRRCAVPTSQITYTDQDFTDIANDELQDLVVPLMMSTREEYFLDFVDISVGADKEIEIPSYAVGEKLRSVAFKQQDDPLILVNLPRLDLDVVTGIGFNNYLTLAGFYIQGSKLMLYPNNSVPVGQQIRVYYYKRALTLAAPSEYGQVQSIDTMGLSFVLDSVPADWAIGTVLNSVSNLQGFKVTNSAMTITMISAPTVFVDTVDDLVVGDYVSQQNYSAVPQIPIEAHGYLAQLTASRCLEGLGDSNGFQVAESKAEKMKQSLLVVVSNRVDGSPKKVVNPSGGFRSNWRNNGWGW